MMDDRATANCEATKGVPARRPAATSRRRFLGAVGAGAAVLAGPGVGTAAAQETEGKVVFVYDDGYEEDYTQTYPVHDQEGVPACIATPSVNIDRGDRFLSSDQVDNMVESGWEVISHGREHEKLGPTGVIRDVQPDDTRVYVDSTAHARTPNEVEIYTGDKRAVSELTGEVGEDDAGEYMELASSVGESFDADNDVQLRFTEEVTRAALKESRDQLREYGWNTRNLVLPYDIWDQRTLDIAAEYYDAIANVYRGGINGGAAADPYSLRRNYYRPGLMTEDELASLLDQTRTNNGLTILTAHSRNPNMTGERTLTAIQMCKERNLDVVTLQTALEEFGIVDPNETQSPGGNETDGGGTGGDGDGNGDGGTGGNGGGGSIIDAFLQWLADLFDGLFG